MGEGAVRGAGARAVRRGDGYYALAHRLDTRVWIAVTLISAGMWTFVLRRVHKAQYASPFRPNRTMPPPRRKPAAPPQKK